MSIVTKTGDQGETGRFGGGRVGKSHHRIEAIGCADELNSAIGLLTARPDIPEPVPGDLKRIQDACFTIGAELSISSEATPEARDYIPRVAAADVEFLEARITALEGSLVSQQRFLLPGGSPAAAMSFWIRTLARRAERAVVASSQAEPVSSVLLQYLNRLSDYFYVLARFLNARSGVAEVEWVGGKSRTFLKSDC